jgi:hypothetical protein
MESPEEQQMKRRRGRSRKSEQMGRKSISAPMPIVHQRIEALEMLKKQRERKAERDCLKRPKSLLILRLEDDDNDYVKFMLKRAQKRESSAEQPSTSCDKLLNVTSSTHYSEPMKKKKMRSAFLESDIGDEPTEPVSVTVASDEVIHIDCAQIDDAQLVVPKKKQSLASKVRCSFLFLSRDNSICYICYF